jgi:hypothetical protein
VSVHHEDSISSGGPSSTHNPVARRLFPEANIDSTTLTAVPNTTTSIPMTTTVDGVPIHVDNIGITNTAPMPATNLCKTCKIHQLGLPFNGHLPIIQFFHKPSNKYLPTRIIVILNFIHHTIRNILDTDKHSSDTFPRTSCPNFSYIFTYST